MLTNFDLLKARTSTNTQPEVVGGGVAIIHRDDISVRQLDVGTPTEFEVLATRLTLRPTDHVIVVCIHPVQ